MPWEFSWLQYLGCVLAVAWYARGIRRMAPDARPARWRRLFYYAGVVSLYVVTQTKFTFLAQHLFVATQAQQFVLHDSGPFLIALAWPGAVLKEGMPALLSKLARSRPARTALDIVQQPLLASVLFIALIVSQVEPAVVSRMMLDRNFFDGMNILMAVEGILFWCLVLDPRPRPAAPVSYGIRTLLAFIVMLPVMPIGGYLAFTSQLHYDVYDICGRLDWFTPLNDQSLGGLILWIPGGLMSAIAVILPLNAMRLAEERQERLSGKTLVQVGQLQIDPSTWTGR
jgi:putative membrane protein